MPLSLTRHEVLHVHLLLPLPVPPDAERREAEQDGRAQRRPRPHPGDDVAPVVLEVGVAGEDVGPGLDEGLNVGALVDLHRLVVLLRVEEADAASGEQAWKVNVFLWEFICSCLKM